jgi:hypothetical protein
MRLWFGGSAIHDRAARGANQHVGDQKDVAQRDLHAGARDDRADDDRFPVGHERGGGLMTRREVELEDAAVGLDHHLQVGKSEDAGPLVVHTRLSCRSR